MNRVLFAPAAVALFALIAGCQQPTSPVPAAPPPAKNQPAVSGQRGGAESGGQPSGALSGAPAGAQPEDPFADPTAAPTPRPEKPPRPEGPPSERKVLESVGNSLWKGFVGDTSGRKKPQQEGPAANSGP